MANHEQHLIFTGIIVEETGGSVSWFELIELTHAEPTLIIELVEETLVEPEQKNQNLKPEQWTFTSYHAKRAKKAVELIRDLHLNTAGVALALDLLDQIKLLKSQLAHLQRFEK